ncbi:hypothetical protein METH_08710 [Leisingera methylohalidivorans DSM 14336]|uniref:Reverse transcriptase domain-containing protein n=2 Tax=Leisingera methylohalidivorans TaxID=133924 RepID=V9W052_9RHOB|nr:hypothetical protein METH_08710 [Leisingera methylohalidivorans DSM 14336]
MPGLASEVVDTIDWEKAARNIEVDSRSDFILAPHLDIVFRDKSADLINQLKSKLAAGTYEPQLPVTISAPKQGVLTRPGSILLPQDRLLYQGLLENMLPEIEAQFDRTRSFSHIPSTEADRLFDPSFEGWNKFQRRVEAICGDMDFVLQCDVANYFETLPQHNLVNALEGCGCRAESVRLMEKLLLAFRQKSSQGIIQGVFPSDVLGNFYLTDFDANCSLFDHPSARYVDDFYIGFSTELDAKLFLAEMIESMRKVGLALNPTKTRILASNELLFEQREVDRLFEEARDEVEAARDLVENGGYGFQGDWVNSDEVEEAISDGLDEELLAVRALLDYHDDTPEISEKIDRFALPYLRAAGDDYGVERAFDGLARRPHLTRHYFSYLNHFARINQDVRERIEALICANGFYLDYQRMYHAAGVMTCDAVSAETVAHVMSWFRNRSIGSHTRAISAIFACKFGTARERREVRAAYDEEPPYVQAAILYSSQFFTVAEKRTMKAAWKGHSDLNALISAAV